MERILRRTPFTEVNSLETRVAALERRYEPDPPNLPAAIMDVSDDGSSNYEFLQPNDTDHVELLTDESAAVFGSVVEDQGGGQYLNAITVKTNGLYLAEARAIVPVGLNSDFAFFLLANANAPNGGAIPALDRPGNNTGVIIDYNSRIQTLANTFEFDNIVPVHTFYYRINDVWGIDPDDATTYVKLYPMRWIEAFGGGATELPFTGDISARYTVSRLGDVLP